MNRTTGQTGNQVKSRANGSRLGRPTKAESQRRHEELLDRALDIFLEHGFEQTTTAEIATAAGMSKRTIYAHYPDKEALFETAVRRAADRYTVPLERLKAVESDDLEETLLAVAHIRIANLATPTGIRLQRILNAEAFRFPELFRTVSEQFTGPTIAFLAELFSRLHARGEVDIGEPERTAFAFLALVLGGPTRLITAGSRVDEEEIEMHIRFSVELFLNGIRSR